MFFFKMIGGNWSFHFVRAFWVIPRKEQGLAFQTPNFWKPVDLFWYASAMTTNWKYPLKEKKSIIYKKCDTVVWHINFFWLINNFEGFSNVVQDLIKVCVLRCHWWQNVCWSRSKTMSQNGLSYQMCNTYSDWDTKMNPSFLGKITVM